MFDTEKLQRNYYTFDFEGDGTLSYSWCPISFKRSSCKVEVWKEVEFLLGLFLAADFFSLTTPYWDSESRGMNLGLSFLDEPELGVPLVACLTSLLLVCGDILLLAETKFLTKKHEKSISRKKRTLLTYSLILLTIHLHFFGLWMTYDWPQGQDQ